MDLLQVSLIFLILLLSIFLAITGFQVFLILRDLKKALDRLNKSLPAVNSGVSQRDKFVSRDRNRVLQTTDVIVPTTNLISSLSTGAKSKPKQKRFYKKVL